MLRETDSAISDAAKIVDFKRFNLNICTLLLGTRRATTQDYGQQTECQGAFYVPATRESELNCAKFTDFADNSEILAVTASRSRQFFRLPYQTSVLLVIF
jgi:hypothetical protein